MTQPNVQVKITVNDKNAEAALLTLESLLSDASMEEWLRENAVGILAARLHDRFSLEGDDATGQWQPLAMSTQRIRQSLGYAPDHPINQRTHEMMDDIMTDPGDIQGSGDYILTWPGTNISQDLEEKLTTAQYGRGNPRTVPRPVLAASNVDLQLLTDDLGQHISSGLIGFNP